jgi:hypothetical protein
MTGCGFKGALRPDSEFSMRPIFEKVDFGGDTESIRGEFGRTACREGRARNLKFELRNIFQEFRGAARRPKKRTRSMTITSSKKIKQDLGDVRRDFELSRFITFRGMIH